MITATLPADPMIERKALNREYLAIVDRWQFTIDPEDERRLLQKMADVDRRIDNWEFLYR